MSDDEPDFLDLLLKPNRCVPVNQRRGIEPGHRRTFNLIKRHFRSLNRGRISVDECKRRLRRNYLKTGCYYGPVGWCDEEGS